MIIYWWSFETMPAISFGRFFWCLVFRGLPCIGGCGRCARTIWSMKDGCCPTCTWKSPPLACFGHLRSTPRTPSASESKPRSSFAVWFDAVLLRAVFPIGQIVPEATFGKMYFFEWSCVKTFIFIFVVSPVFAEEARRVVAFLALQRRKPQVCVGAVIE